MDNLAGRPNADRACALELQTAGIPIVIDETPHSREVQSTTYGKLGPFTFKRAWYYWCVDGPTPIAMAREMWADPIGQRDVRVDGYAGNRPLEPGRATVDSYHIDSQDGLNLFASMARKYGLDKVGA